MTVLRPIAFVLAAANHGAMIVNRHDYRMADAARGYGVGYQILNSSSFDQPEVNLLLALLQLRRMHFGDGVVALDCGANIGVHTLEWARAMTGWGRVTAFEAQERIFYALAGNIALNNCLNASARHAAVGGECGVLRIPQPDYLSPSSFGSLELRQTGTTEFIGQSHRLFRFGHVAGHHAHDRFAGLPRVDLIKIDVEGMEDGGAGRCGWDAGAREARYCSSNSSNPIKAAITGRLSAAGYRLFQIELNAMAVHVDDPALGHITLTDGQLHIR